MSHAKQSLRWLPLDNAAKIYPAARRKNWSNVFRLSATLAEPVDTAVLQSAAALTAKRFPSMAVRLRRGVLWYYLQQLAQPPQLHRESSYPLTQMGKEETRRCAMRIIPYGNRIAVEYFHSLTDGTGALIFLKTLVAEYLQQKHGIRIPATHGILDRQESPKAEELEDSFLRYAGPLQASRKENTAWRLSGTPELGGFAHVTCFRLPVEETLALAHKYGVSLTVFLTAVMMDALQRLQSEKVADIRRRKPIKVLIPVNLRPLFPSKTLRNFAMYTTPEILPRMGTYSLEEICRIIQHRMGLDITPKQMGMKITTNVASEKLLIVRILPLFIKNLVMKAIFDTVGERQSCLTLSNLGQVKLPEEMKGYIQRMDFILGVQAASPYNCGVLSWDDTVYVNFIRDIREPDLERYFYEVLHQLGLPVTVESN